ncbi:MAG: hypothetical protein WC050_00540 [Candidatus Paceibacterota bacterium]
MEALGALYPVLLIGGGILATVILGLWVKHTNTKRGGEINEDRDQMMNGIAKRFNMTASSLREEIEQKKVIGTDKEVVLRQLSGSINRRHVIIRDMIDVEPGVDPRKDAALTGGLLGGDGANTPWTRFCLDGVPKNYKRKAYFFGIPIGTYETLAQKEDIECFLASI